MYEQNVSKIGLLPEPLPEKLAQFYTFVYSILEDFQNIAKPEFALNGSDLKVFLEELLGIFREAIKLAEEIKTLIKP